MFKGLRNVYCGTYFTHVQTCNVTRVQRVTEWTASVHTLHSPNLVTSLGGLRGGSLTEGFQVPSSGGYLKGGFQVLSAGVKGGYLKEGLHGTFRELTGGYLKVTLRGGLRGGLRSP